MIIKKTKKNKTVFRSLEPGFFSSLTQAHDVFHGMTGKQLCNNHFLTVGDMTACM